MPPSDLARAVDALRRGGLVALPTETVYGLGADASNELAVRRIFAVKGRPSSHPLIVHVVSLEEARRWVRAVPETAETLGRALWPGPLTLVLWRSALASDAVTGGQDTVAVRVPGHPLAIELLEAFGGGIAAPSAHRLGRRGVHHRRPHGPDAPPPPAGRHLGRDPRGAPGSTCTTGRGRLRRPGSGDARVALRSSGRRSTRRGGVGRRQGARGRRSGAPSGDPRALRLDARLVSLEVPEDDAGFARVLYARLREADELGDLLLVVPPSETGLGLAVADRLRRAAAPRGS